MKKVVKFGLLVFSVAIFGACSSNNDSSKTVSSLKKEISRLESENSDLQSRISAYESYSEETTEESEESEESSTETKEFNLGESATFTTGEKVTVTEVKSDDSVEMYDLKEGEHGVVVTAIVENTTTSPFSFNAQTFDLYDGNDEIGDFNASTYNNNIPSDIAAGKKATVIINFATKGNAPYYVTYGPATWIRKKKKKHAPPTKK